MKASIVSVLAVASTALAWGPPVSQISDGQPQAPTATAWTSAAAGYTTWTSAVASMTSAWSTAPVMSSPAPYPVPGGNMTTWASTGTAPPATMSTAAPTTWQTSAAPTTGSAPAPSAPAATGAAAALQIGGAALAAGIFAFLA